MFLHCGRDREGQKALAHVATLGSAGGCGQDGGRGDGGDGGEGSPTPGRITSSGVRALASAPHIEPFGPPVLGPTVELEGHL